MSDSLMSEAPTVKIYDQLVNARDSCAAARKHLMEIEDKVIPLSPYFYIYHFDSCNFNHI